MDDVLTPEIDYDTWTCLFSTSIEPGGDFLLLVPGYCEQINYILENNTLSDSIADFTLEFIQQFVPNVVEQVINLGYVNQSDAQIINLFLLSTVDLISWLCVHNTLCENTYEILKRLLPVLLPEETPYYLRNGSSRYYKREVFFDEETGDEKTKGNYVVEFSKHWKRVFQHYVNLCIPSIVNRVGQANPTFYQFSFIFMVIKYIDYLETPINENILEPAILAFIPFLEQNDLRNSETPISDIQQCVLDFTCFIERYFHNVIPSIIKMSDLFIRSNVLDRQFIGAKIICTLNESQNEEVQFYFDEWRKETDLAEYVLANDLNNTLYERIQPILAILMKKELLFTFWENALKVHPSQRKPMFDIISKSIALIDEESCCEFLSFIETSSISSFLVQHSTQDSQKENENSNNNYSLLINNDINLLDFFTESAKYLIFNKKENLAKKVIKIIFQIALQSGNNNYSTNYIIKLNKIKQFQPIMFDECCDCLVTVKGSEELICSVLENLISGSNNFPFKKLKNIILKNVETNNFSHPYVKRIYCNLFSKILKVSQLPVTQKVIETFSKSQIDDSLFTLLVNSMKDLGLNAFNSDLNKFLYSLIIQYSREISKNTSQNNTKESEGDIIGFYKYNFAYASEAFCEFMMIFLLKTNLEKQNIEPKYRNDSELNLNPDKFLTMKLPIDNLPIVIQIYCQIQNDYVSKFLLTNILRLFTQTHISLEVLTKYIYLLVYPFLEKPDNSAGRALLIIKKIITQKENGIDLTEFGYERHKRVNPENLITVNIKVENSPSIHQIKTVLNAKLSEILTRLSKILNSKTHSLSLYKDNIYLNPTLTLLENGIYDGCTLKLIVYGNKVYKDLTFPSIVLTELNFQDTLLKIVDESSNQNLIKIASEILNLLPNAPSLRTVSIEDVGKSNSKIVLLYKLQIYTQSTEKLENVEFLFEILNQYSREDQEITSEILSFLNHHFDATILENYVEKLTKLCLNIILTEKGINCRISFNLLITMLKERCYSSQITNIILEDIKNFEILIRKTQFIEKLKELICCLDNQQPIFEICIQNLDKPHNSNFVEIFSVVLNNIGDFISLTDVFEDCMKLLNEFKDNVVIEICKVIDSILKTDISFAIKYCKVLISKILIKAFSTDNTQVHKSLFSIAEKVIDINVDAKNYAKQFIRPIIQIPRDFYSYRPSNNIRSSLDYSGLRNLGSTCYMNSIFQQLFFVPPFRKKIIEFDTSCEHDETTNSQITNQDNLEAQLKFQKLFSEMLLTRRKSCDTQPFCSVWKGWGRTIINTHDQQDAFEFFQMFLGQFPDSINKYFKGTIKNTFRGEKFESSNDEEFFALGLTIQKCPNIIESFKVFLMSETFPQYKTDDGRVINVEKYAKIGKVPPVLVLQLKRFEYSLTTFERIKINDRCEFPTKINIKDFVIQNHTGSINENNSNDGNCRNGNDDLLYELTGVVLHSGTARGGHYTSVIKLKGRWYWFNDMEVSVISESEFEKMAYGGRSKNNDFDADPCAYLLFYTKIGAEDEGVSLFANKMTQKMIDYVKPNIKDEIQNDNHEYLNLQCSFSKELFDFIMSINDPFVLIDYFINVFCHSGLNEFSIKAQNILVNSIENYTGGDIYPYFIKYSHLIDEILSKCTNIDINESLTSVILACCKKVEPKVSIYYIDHFFTVLFSVMKNWRQIPPFCKIFHEFLMNGDDYVDVAYQDDWPNKLINIINVIYEGQKSSILLQNIDLSDLFYSLFIFTENFEINGLQNIIQKYTNQILTSQVNTSSFITLVSKLSEKGIVEIGSFLLTLSSKDVDEKVFNDVFMSAIESTTNSGQATSVINCFLNLNSTKMAGVTRHLLLLLDENNDTLRHFFLDYPKETILKMVTYKTKYSRGSIENIITSLFNQVKVSPDLNTFGTNRQTLRITTPFSDLKQESDYTIINPSQDGENIYEMLNDTINDQMENKSCEIISNNYYVTNLKTRSELKILFDAFVDYIDEVIVGHISDFYLFKDDDKYRYWNEQKYQLVTLLKILNWLILALGYESADLSYLLDVTNRLYSECLTMNEKIDYNLVYLCDIYSHFNADIVDKIALDLFSHIFCHFDEINDAYNVSEPFYHFWKLQKKCSEEIFYYILQIPYFATAFNKLKYAHSYHAKPVFRDICRKLIREIRKYKFKQNLNQSHTLDSNKKENESDDENIAVSENKFENIALKVAKTMFVDSPENNRIFDTGIVEVFILFYVIIDELDIATIQRAVSLILSSIVEKFRHVTYDETRKEILLLYDMMNCLLNFVENHQNINFQTNQIDYGDLIEYIIAVRDNPELRDPFMNTIRIITEREPIFLTIICRYFDLVTRKKKGKLAERTVFAWTNLCLYIAMNKNTNENVSDENETYSKEDGINEYVYSDYIDDDDDDEGRENNEKLVLELTKLIKFYDKVSLMPDLKMQLDAIFQCARDVSYRAVRVIFVLLNNCLQNSISPFFLQYATHLTLTEFLTEASEVLYGSREVYHYYSAGIKEMNENVVIAMFKYLCSQIQNISGIKSDFDLMIIRKLALIITKRSEIKEKLREIFKYYINPEIFEVNEFETLYDTIHKLSKVFYGICPKSQIKDGNKETKEIEENKENEEEELLESLETLEKGKNHYNKNEIQKESEKENDYDYDYEFDQPFDESDQADNDENDDPEVTMEIGNIFD
ncbi:hypothetical protein TRFO_25582 [Tritrichomonas foetus]|uniref:USP domain-containing protein n=1 Tax=Tritrichomonas foetus TaxID=1144522 RepID=A0A1J4K550_9EUKA|nr:hypothetical protein TRFO_25582 [Tritrichomonas foetus]|eukprot:OHT06323.1 hypothetical protein TRFO_25582 [Tritrichomonas foetus]